MIKRSEVLLILFSTSLTLAVAYHVLRWLAPGLVGVPQDLELVALDTTVPPFYENIFRDADYQSDEYFPKDPIFKMRGKPLQEYDGLLGPHDVLGFRNQEVPNHPSIITIGDSQTYGNNAIAANNWPGHLKQLLKQNNHKVYNMSLGGWSAPQYLQAARHAVKFKPHGLVVAYYTGNDALESFSLAYGSEYWQALRLNPKLSAADAPKVVFPPPESEDWKVTFSNGYQTTLTPKLRWLTNQDHPAVNAGYAIMLKTAELIADICRANNVKLYLTIIPTKELAFYAKITSDNIPPREDYQALIVAEHERVKYLISGYQKINDATYVDVISDLQQQIKLVPSAQLKYFYPADINGHPYTLGYKTIAQTIAKQIESQLPAMPQGLLAVFNSQNRYQLILASKGKYWIADKDWLHDHGWTTGEHATVPSIKWHDIRNMEMAGETVDLPAERSSPDTFQ